MRKIFRLIGLYNFIFNRIINIFKIVYLQNIYIEYINKQIYYLNIFVV